MTNSLNSSPEAARLYLDILKQTLTRVIHPEKYGQPDVRDLSVWPELCNTWLRERNLALVKLQRLDRETRANGRDWPAEAETMIGLHRLNNLQECLESILFENVPGDLLEAGVWRGGASIFMRGLLKAYGVTDRMVWLADSFEGLPQPDPQRYPRDKGDAQWTYSELAVSLATVQANFQKYGLLDPQVAFLPGWFRDTLPSAPVNQLALLRLDGDLYESTMITLRSLYPKLSAGGYVIVDDYGALETCRAAVEDFRAEFGIREELVRIDWTGVYWRVERPIPPIAEVLAVPQKTERERTTAAEHEPALHTLLQLYESRPDLRQAYPEAVHWDFRRLVKWARRVATGECVDSSARLLTPFADWFALNSVDLSTPWDLIETGSQMSTNPMPHLLQEMRRSTTSDIVEHLTTLALLVTEFDLKQVVEVGTREGQSTIALLEAAKSVHGRVLSIDVEPCLAARNLITALGLADHWKFQQCNALKMNESEIPRPIDLLFVDTFHLYSQTLAELRRFAPYVRPGGWIVLHDSVSFPGVSKAILETMLSLPSKPRFYPYIHQNGLSLVRISEEFTRSA